MQRNYELIIFDCDGVVIDSEIISASVLVEKLNACDVKVDLNYVLSHFLGRSFPTVRKLIEDTFSIRLSDGFEADYRNTLLARFQTELHETNGFSAMLSALKIKKCIATSSSPKRVSGSLSQLNLTDDFGQNVFTASEVKQGKPAPDLFLHAAKTMGINPENCLVIEDSPPGIQAGLAANMTVIHYRGGAHLVKSTPTKLEPSVQVISHWKELISLYPHLFK
ncbi:HAD family hydrolase [Catenovulum sediminis]|uniref:HAD family hydrolase n=1 Tax=Catenovulum sediminis TaxID=1740262 RepID=A0ABV1RI97_9ALTE